MNKNEANELLRESQRYLIDAKKNLNKSIIQPTDLREIDACLDHIMSKIEELIILSADLE